LDCKFVGLVQIDPQQHGHLRGTYILLVKKSKAKRNKEEEEYLKLVAGGN